MFKIPREIAKSLRKHPLLMASLGVLWLVWVAASTGLSPVAVVGCLAGLVFYKVLDNEADSIVDGRPSRPLPVRQQVLAWLSILLGTAAVAFALWHMMKNAPGGNMVSPSVAKHDAKWLVIGSEVLAWLTSPGLTAADLQVRFLVFTGFSLASYIIAYSLSSGVAPLLCLAFGLVCLASTSAAILQPLIWVFRLVH